MKVIFVFGLLMFWVGHVTCSLDTEYLHHATLDEDNKYQLYWTVEADEVLFAVQVHTMGWVGLGISTGAGQMSQSDVIIGWVKNGQGVIQDRFAAGYGVPRLDKRQDVELTGFKEENGKTTLEFKRKIDTCDKKDDHPIKEGTVRLIWAYHTADPVSADSLMKHTKRGSKSVMVLNSYKGNTQLPSNYTTYDFIMDKVAVPSDHTTYWCKVFKLPDLGGKRHVIMMEAVVEPGNEGLVHHMLLFMCSKNFNDTHRDHSNKCSHPNMPRDVRKCRVAIMYAWAIGAGNFTFPEHVGFPLGDEGGPAYLLLEMHYDNPKEESGRRDSSGIRFYMTPELRQHDADMLVLGVSLNNGMVIPPKEEGLSITGYCPDTCTQQAIPAPGIKTFAVMPHTHLQGYSIHLHHVRNGIELPLLIKDDNYDFNFQEYQFLKKEVEIKPGDELLTECKYNTMNKDTVTLGGESTQEEMCYSFVMYYPKMNLKQCFSLDQGIYYLKYEKFYVPPTNTTPGYLNGSWATNWKDEYRYDIDKAYKENTKITVSCRGANGSYLGHSHYRDWFDKPSITKKYQYEEVCKKQPGTDPESFALPAKAWIALIGACALLTTVTMM